MARMGKWLSRLLGAIIILCALLLIAVMVISYTQWGMDQARRIALNGLRSKVNGELEVARASGGGLLQGVVFHGVAITDTATGKSFATVDSISVRYNGARLLLSWFGQVLLGPITLYRPQLTLAQLPGDSLWNFDRLFRTGAPGGGPATRLVRFDDATLVDGHIIVRRPYTDTAQGGMAERFVLEDTPLGRVQVMDFQHVNAHILSFTLSQPGSGTREVRLDHLATRAHVLRTPVELTDARGSVTIADSLIGIDIPELHFARSVAAVTGQLHRRAGGMTYDLRVDGKDLRLADLRWIDARLPEQGRAKFALHLESTAGGELLLSFSRLDLEAPGTRVNGTFGYRTGRHPQLRAVDLRLGALDLDWVAAALGRELPLSGRLAGRVQAAGPLAQLQTSGDLTLAGWGGAGVPSVRWTGTLDLEHAGTLSGLNTEFTDLDLALLERLRPGLGLAGTASGRLDLDGNIQQSMQVRTVLRHELRGQVSQLNGGGRVASSAGITRMDLAFDAQPLRLETLARMVPQLDSLRGRARGRITLAGSTDSMDVSLDARTDAGPVKLSATVDRRGTLPAVVAEAQLQDFQPARIGLAPIEATLTGRITANLMGNNLENLSGPLHADIASGVIMGFPLERSRLTAILADGFATLDSAFFRAPGMRATATGRFGLTAAHSDSIRIAIESESLAQLEPLILGQVLDPTAPRVDGSGRATVVLNGSLAGFAVGADARLDHLRVEEQSSAFTHIRFDATGVRTDNMAYRVTLAADSVRALGAVTDSARGSLSMQGDSGSLSVLTWRAGERAAQVAARFHDAGEGLTEWRVEELRFRSGPGEWSLAAPTSLLWGTRSIRMSNARLVSDQGGGLTGTGMLAWQDTTGFGVPDAALDFDLRMTDVPTRLIPQAVRPAGDVGGVLEGSVHIAGTTATPEIRAEVAATGLKFQTATLERLRFLFTYRDRLIDAQVSAFLADREVMSGVGTIPVDLRFGPVDQRVLNEPVDFTMRMDSFPAAFVFGLLHGFSDIQGSFKGDLEAGGSAREPKLSGAMLLAGGAATWDATGVRYTDAEGSFLMNQELSATIDFTARTRDPRGGSRGGSARITGTVDLQQASDPGFDLTLVASSVLAAKRRDMEVTASGRVAIGGHYQGPRISGNVTIDRGTIFLDEIYRQYLIVPLEDPLLLGVIDTTLMSVRNVLPASENPFLRNLRVENLQLSVGSDAWLRGRQMNVELAGDISVDYDRRAQNLVLNGSLQAVRGTYRLEYGFLARVFEVQNGTVEFPGTPGMDPNLSIRAVYTARTGDQPIDISAEVTGTLTSPRVRLTSDVQPPISESDLASYLFFGAPTTAFASGSSTGGGVFSGLGRSVLEASGLGLFAGGLQTLGQSVGLVDYVGLTAAEASPARDTGIGGFLSGTRIELGRYITPRLFLIYTQPLNSTARDPGIRLEWRFHPTYTAEIFTEDRFARAPSFGLTQAFSLRRVYGFLLYREWSY
jgi:hypothetical protein